MGKISVAIAAFNEEENIGDCLKSVRQLADEVVVVDGSSTDQTRVIAKKSGARVIKTTNPPIFHINKNKAIDACSGDWILSLDADERVSPQLTTEIKKIAAKKWQPGDPAGYWLKRKNLFLGAFLKKGGQYPDPVIRFFKKGQGRHPALSVHEQIKIKGRVGRFQNELIHLGTPSLNRYFIRENRYAALEAAEMAQKDLSLGPLTFFKYGWFLPSKTFLSLFFRHKGFFDGWRGFLFAFFSALHYPWAYIKYWRMKH